MASDYRNYDYILCADSENVRNMLRLFGPDGDRKVHMLMDYSEDPGDHGKSISDPWYTRNFTRAFEDAKRGCEGFLKGLGFRIRYIR